MKKLSTKLRLHTRATTPPPPPAYEPHPLDDTQLAGTFPGMQISPQEHAFENAHGAPRPPEKGEKENILTYLEDHDIPEHPPAPYSPAEYLTAGQPSPGYALDGYSIPGQSSAGHMVEGYFPPGHSPSGHSMAAPSISGQSMAGPSTSGLSISGHSMAGYSTTEHTVPSHSVSREHHLQPHPSSHFSRVQSEGPPSVRSMDIQPPVESPAERGGTIKYSFSPIGTNAMALLSSSGAQGSRPKYYISVSLNCFMPSSHITTVYRGADEHAPRVCEFEMGIISAGNSRLRMEGYNPDPISKLLMSVPRQTARWVWKLPNDTSCILLWDCSRMPFTCTAELARKAPSQLVARFTSHIQSLPGDPRNPAPDLSMLEVLPAGRRRLDDILISVLIIERIRLTPNPKSPFNY